MGIFDKIVEKYMTEKAREEDLTVKKAVIAKRIVKYPENIYREGTQKHRLHEALVGKGELHIYDMITPQPLGGLGVARYGARIGEMRKDLVKVGWTIRVYEEEYLYKMEEIKNNE